MPEEDALQRLRATILSRLRSAIQTDRPVSGEERGLASQFLDTVLGNPPAPGNPMSGGRQEPYFNRPNGTEPLPSSQQEFALMLSKQLYPNAWPYADSRVGTFDKPFTAGSTSSGFIHFNPNDPVNLSMEGSLDTLRHELSHAVGLDDVRSGGRPSAYDVSNVSGLLHRDITLPKKSSR